MGKNNPENLGGQAKRTILIPLPNGQFKEMDEVPGGGISPQDEKLVLRYAEKRTVRILIGPEHQVVDLLALPGGGVFEIGRVFPVDSPKKKKNL